MADSFKILSALIVYIFSAYFGFGQTQIGQDIDGENSFDFSGFALDMPDPNTLAIGAYHNSGTANEAGHVRIYMRVGTTWVQKGLDINGEAANDWSGKSLSMPDANTIAIGAEQNIGGGSTAGHVRIFYWNGTAWTQKGSDINGLSPNESCGYSVSMPTANTVAIGAPQNDNSVDNAGAVRVYDWLNNGWVQRGGTIYGEAEADFSGQCVVMPDPNTVAIGASNNDASGNNAGHVRVYHWLNNSWTQLGSDIDAEGPGDNFGYSISMPNATTLASGAYGNNGTGIYQGSVRVYQWSGSSWVQKGNDIDGESNNDGSGISVHMPDEHTVAIGADANDGNGSNSGHVRVFFWNGANWVQQGVDINGEAAFDGSGKDVCMPDRYTVAVGAPANSGGGPYSGHVRVFRLCFDSILVQVQDFTAFTGVGWANFKCKHTDSSASYQWQMLSGTTWVNLTNQSNFSGALSDSLIITGVTPSLSGKKFRCVISGSCSVDTTNSGVLNVVNGIGIEPANTSYIKVFPNPTTGKIRIGGGFQGSITLFDHNGSILYYGDAIDELNISSWPNGVYTLLLSNANLNLRHRIIKL